MTDNVTEQQAPQQQVASTNWDAFTNDHTDTPLTQDKPKAEEVKETPILEQINPEVKTEDKPAEEKPVVEETKVEDKPVTETAKEEIINEAPLVEFKADEILKDITLADEGTWLRVAQDLKIEGVSEDTFESFKEALLKPIADELASVKTQQKLDVFATLKPETAANLMLMEMGVKEDELFAPTREIEKYLSFGDAELVRADYEALNWTEEMIDAEMELLDTKGLVKHQADKIRMTLNDTKENILNERTELVQRFNSQKEQATLRQKEQDFTHFKEAMATAPEFMGMPVKDEIKNAIITKYSNGGYDKVFDDANAKLELIFYKELGPQYLKAIKNTASENGRDKVTKKLLNIPPVTNSSVGSKVETNNQSDDNWAAYERDHGK